MPPANRDLIRAINQFHILNTIRTSGAISRVEIAEITGQSRASVTNITAKMIEENLIFEKETASSGERGRNRVLLALNPEAAFVVGVKLSTFRIVCAVADMTGRMISSIVMSMLTRNLPVDSIADLIEDGIRQCVDKAQLPISSISGIGLGIPGFVNSRLGICYWTPLYQKGDIPLKELIEKRFGIKTYVDNDTNTVTLAHQWFGEGRGVNDFLVVSFEEGLSMGIVVNGQLYRGANGIAGEFGHTVVNPDGPSCYCGRKGCLAAYASGVAIILAARKAVDEGKWKRARDDEITLEEVIEAAKEDKDVFRSIFERIGSYLGIGLSSLIQAFNPQKIIITGSAVMVGDLMFKTMNEAVQSRIDVDLGHSVDIVIPEWHHTDWAQGAASLVLQELYKSPFNAIRPVI